MNVTGSLLSLTAALLLCPFLRSIINRTKAFLAGRQGAPLLQPYYEIIKLLKKGAVYSQTTSWVFRAGPILGLTSILGALLLIPAAGCPALIHFRGDLILFAYLLGVGRFMTILAAMDTGSSFEGMGASREAFFSALVEPGFMLGLAGLAVLTRSISLTDIFSGINAATLAASQLPAIIFIFFALIITYLTENARIPVDDPATHLELTMIHEVMILDHSGVDLALIEYGGALKLWVLGLLVTGLVPFRSGSVYPDLALSIIALFVLALIVGVVESSMARFRLKRVPLFLAISFVFSALGVLWIIR